MPSDRRIGAETGDGCERVPPCASVRSRAAPTTLWPHRSSRRMLVANVTASRVGVPVGSLRCGKRVDRAAYSLASGHLLAQFTPSLPLSAKRGHHQPHQTPHRVPCPRDPWARRRTHADGVGRAAARARPTPCPRPPPSARLRHDHHPQDPPDIVERGQGCAGYLTHPACVVWPDGSGSQHRWSWEVGVLIRWRLRRGFLSSIRPRNGGGDGQSV